MSDVTRSGPFALVVAVAALLGGCGGDDSDDRLSKDETAQRVNRVFRATSGEIQRQFHPIFEQLPQGREHARVPQRVRAQLEPPSTTVARELREAADRVAELDAPADVEDELDSLADAARQQAARLEELPAKQTLTVSELADAVAPPMEALRRLREAGIDVRPPRGA